MVFAQSVFTPDQTVHYIGDPDGVNGIVQGMAWDSEKGWVYKVSSTQLDYVKRVVSEGIITVLETELVAVEAE